METQKWYDERHERLTEQITEMLQRTHDVEFDEDLERFKFEALKFRVDTGALLQSLVKIYATAALLRFTGDALSELILSKLSWTAGKIKSKNLKELMCDGRAGFSLVKLVRAAAEDDAAAGNRYLGPKEIMKMVRRLTYQVIGKPAVSVCQACDEFHSAGLRCALRLEKCHNCGKAGHGTAICSKF